MPTATFRCSASGDQETVELTYHRRVVGEADVARPRPKCDRHGCPRFHHPMDELVQVDYGQGAI